MSRATELNNKISMCVAMCNTLLQNVATTVHNDFPYDPMISTYSSALTDFIKNKPLEPISLFLMHVYANDTYRKNIIAKNESFFMASTYDKVVGSDNKKIEMMFMFKQQWGNMGDELKDYVKDSMATLIEICRQYVEYKGLLSDISKAK
jgi:hypothetical protein